MSPAPPLSRAGVKPCRISRNSSAAGHARRGQDSQGVAADTVREGALRYSLSSHSPSYSPSPSHSPSHLSLSLSLSLFLLLSLLSPSLSLSLLLSLSL